MGRGPSAKGEEARLRILEELARRYVEFDLQPTWEALSSTVDIPLGTLRYHILKLQAKGLVHPSGLWITRAGMLHIGAIVD